MKSKKEKTCKACKKIFISFRHYDGRKSCFSRYCSRRCFYPNLRTLPKENKCNTCGKIVQNTTGHVRSFCSTKCINVGRIPWNQGKRDRTFKGTETEYKYLHAWVQKKLGKPTTCILCKKTGLTGRKIHWANVSRRYLFSTDDWIRLCVPCHGKFDTKNSRRSRVYSLL